MNHHIFNIAAISAALLLAPCTAVFGQNTGLSQHAQTFLKDMAQGNVAEIELGKLAEQKGSTAAIRDFGQRMVRDHTALNNQLKQLASAENVSLPTTINSQQQQEKQNLEHLSGKHFDEQYIKTMLMDHQKDVQAVQQEAENAQNPQVKMLAAKALPIVEDHLRIAENDAGKLGVSSYEGLNQPEHPTGYAGTTASR